MICFLSMPRPFVGEFDKLQRMAIASWKEAAPGCQILLFGNETGIVNAAYDLGAQRFPLEHYTRSGSPIVTGVFETGELTERPWLCFVSADIVFSANLPEVLDVLEGVERPFVIGQRRDIEPGASPNTAKLHPPCGVDYFFYRPGTIGPVPPFSVRGGGGDNWFVWKACTAWRMTVIDATDAIYAIHVNHSHPEWENGKAGRQGSVEQRENLRLATADGMPRPYGVDDVPWVLGNGKLVKRWAVTA